MRVDRDMAWLVIVKDDAKKKKGKHFSSRSPKHKYDKKPGDGYQEYYKSSNETNPCYKKGKFFQKLQ